MAADELIDELGRALSALREAEKELRAHGESWDTVARAIMRIEFLLQRYARAL